MKLESLQCNKCGAEIEVSADTRFATCAHCGSKLAVVRTASAAYTELAEKMAELSDHMRDHLQRADRRDALEDLEREWNREKESYMVTGKHGVRHIPTRTQSAIAGIVITIFGVFWTLMALGITGGLFGAGPGPFGLIGCLFPAFGVLFIVLGVYRSLSAYDKASRYERAEATYLQRRQALLAELEDKGGAKG
jgi:hypothetical protein